jgi:uncharacterized protein YecT (DUF1311 family)
MQWAEQPDQRTKGTLAAQAIGVAQEKFDETQIWLTPTCAKSVDELMAALRYAYNHLAVYLPFMDKPGATEDALRKQQEAWMHSWDSVSSTKVPVARQALEAELRALLAPQRAGT